MSAPTPFNVLLPFMRYFFDIHDTGNYFDDVGVDLDDRQAARKQAISALPAIAAEEIPIDGDRRHFTVLVTDEAGLPVYSATLSYVGLWLYRQPEN